MVYTDGILRPPIGDRVPPSMQLLQVSDCSGERDIKDL